LKVYAVLAQEVGFAGGGPPIQWLLLTTWPVRTLKMAVRLVRWYALRWGIECWHKVLKVVCGVERRQMRQAEHLQRALALDMIIASRVLLLTRLGKEHPDLPAELFYSPEELAVLAVKKKKPAATPIAFS
jgi:IS4 transposase